MHPSYIPYRSYPLVSAAWTLRQASARNHHGRSSGTLNNPLSSLPDKIHRCDEVGMTPLSQQFSGQIRSRPAHALPRASGHGHDTGPGTPTTMRQRIALQATAGEQPIESHLHRKPPFLLEPTHLEIQRNLRIALPSQSDTPSHLRSDRLTLLGQAQPSLRGTYHTASSERPRPASSDASYSWIRPPAVPHRHPL